MKSINFPDFKLIHPYRHPHQPAVRTLLAMTATMFPVAILDQQSLDPRELVEEILQESYPGAQQAYLRNLLPFLEKLDWDQLATALKEKTDHLMRADIQACLQTAELIGCITELTGNPTYHALSALALGNAHVIGLGEFRKGIQYCDEAAAIYEEQGRPIDQARTQISKIWALASLGRYDEALATGQWVSEIFQAHGEWLALAKLSSNLAAIHGRMGQDEQALKLLNRAYELYCSLKTKPEEQLLRIDQNRAIVLRNLGRFQDSIKLNKKTLAAYQNLGLAFDAAQVLQVLATTYYVMGRYNEALAAFDNARETFFDDGRHRHAMLVELFVCDCLLQLGRFADVLEKCQAAYKLFHDLGTGFEIGQSFFIQAQAFTGLARHEEALISLDKARQIFVEEENPVAVSDTDLQIAAVLLAQNKCERSLALAQTCTAVFQNHKLPVGQARAYLVAARAALACQKQPEAAEYVSQALAISQQHDIPALTFQAQHLAGTLQILDGNPEAGLATFAQAIQKLEQLYGRLMLEHRSDFLSSKEQLYEDAVSLCLDMAQPEKGLEFSERAKSRALQDLIAHRLNLHIEARHEADQPLVDHLLQLRAQRDQLYRRWETGERASQADKIGDLLNEQQQTSQRILALEKQITDLWHKLLIHNADYARDAALWQVHTEPVQPYLDADTLLLEFFIAHDQLILFAITSQDITAHRLPVALPQVQKLFQLLWLNLNAAAKSHPDRLTALTYNAQKVLGQLYQNLLQPLAERLSAYPKLIIVPHGLLHYLPFHALHDGQQYLIQKHEVSYLPGSSLWRYCQESQPGGTGVLTVGHDHKNQLAHTLREAQEVADLWSGKALLGDEAQLPYFFQIAPQSRIIHLATHGEFRPDNPLFSGLALADGWLTTLDIFNMRLNASLVTLSACQTGRSVIGGGDELLGLMRAFLSAGVSSLVTTLWAVEDVSTADLMQNFYKQLKTGQRKGAALRRAQLQLIEENTSSHPFFWAPFYLVGSPGPL